jgi:hypothetical protein
MTYLRDVADILEDASVGTFGTTIFIGRPPQKPHDIVALMPYGGLDPQRTHNGTDRRFPRVQVMCRAVKMENAVASMESVRAALRAVNQLTIGSTHYEAILPVGEPGLLTNDPSGRFPLVMSYEVRFHVS